MGFFIMKNVLKVVFVIIGTLIGAGFASGQEMYLFFFSHGIQGIFGIIISSVLIGFVIYRTLLILEYYDIKTYKDFLDVIIKFRNKNKYLNLINIIINIFIIITFFIMIAGFGAYFEQEFKINSIIGSSVLAILSFIIFMTSIKGVVKCNEIIIPLLIIFIGLIGFVTLKDVNLFNVSNYMSDSSSINWLIDSIVYSSYNSILLIPVILTLKNYIKNRKNIFYITIISTIIIIILSIIIFSILIKVDVNIENLEMPAVYVISNISKTLRIIYGFIILASIFTTSISLGTSFLQNTSKSKKSYTQFAIIMCITSVIISKIGFSNLVSSLYPIFGYLGLLQILCICSKIRLSLR